MGMLDALMIGATSGAGAGIADAASQYGHFANMQVLENSRANMDVEKAARIEETKLQLADAERQKMAATVGGRAADIAAQQQQNILNQYDPADVDANGQPTGTSSPVTRDDLSPEDQARFDAINPNNPDIRRQAGVDTGYIDPATDAGLANRQELMQLRMDTWRDNMQAKLDAAAAKNETSLAIAKMMSDVKGMHSGERMMLMQGYNADERAETQQITQLQKELDTAISPMNMALIGKDPDKLSAHKDHVTNLQSQLADHQQALSNVRLMRNAVARAMFGGRLPSTPDAVSGNGQPAAPAASPASGSGTLTWDPSTGSFK